MKPRMTRVLATVVLALVLPWGCARGTGLGEQRSGVSLDDQPLEMRVIDVGAGLCCVIKLPGPKYMIYDGGWGAKTMDKIREIIPNGATVDLLVLSHSDADHLAAVPGICEAYHVKRVVRPGYHKAKVTETWKKADAAIAAEVANDGCEETNLADESLTFGDRQKIGAASVYFVAGWDQPPAEWGFKKDTAEYINAGSIVVRIVYKKKSILICGDSVGRDIGDPAVECIAAEKAMVDKKSTVTINSDVMVAPHHGADNGSSTDFIKAVSPDWVIFSAGHKFEHPRAATAERFIAAGVVADHMLRTDRGDDESAEDDLDVTASFREWDFGRVAGMKDPAGDDDVDIFIEKVGESWKVRVGYRN